MVCGTHFLSQGHFLIFFGLENFVNFAKKVVFWDTFLVFGPLLKHGCVPKIDAKRAEKARKTVVFESYGTHYHFFYY